eukprot:194960-Chlamydomonas_euryale.AAC.14
MPGMPGMPIGGMPMPSMNARSRCTLASESSPPSPLPLGPAACGRRSVLQPPRMGITGRGTASAKPGRSCCCRCRRFQGWVVSANRRAGGGAAVPAALATTTARRRSRAMTPPLPLP